MPVAWACTARELWKDVGSCRIFQQLGSCSALLRSVRGVISILCNCGRMILPQPPSCFELECGQETQWAMSYLQIYQGGLRGELCVVLALNYAKNQSGTPTLNQHPDSEVKLWQISC